MAAKDNIIELIKKCLALTGSPNENEAARAMEKAQELLRKYNLSMEDVKARSVEYSGVVKRYYDILGRFLWRKYLVVYVAQNNFCRAYMTYDRDKVSVVGREINVAAAFEMVNWILPQVERLGRQATRKHNPNSLDPETFERVSKQRFRNSFCLGVCDRINRRLRESQLDAEKADADTKAMVVHVMAEVDEWIDRNMTFGASRGGQGPVNASYAGYRAGQAAGDNVSLRNYTRLGGGK